MKKRVVCFPSLRKNLFASNYYLLNLHSSSLTKDNYVLMSLCSKKRSVSSANITVSRFDELGDSLQKESNGSNKDACGKPQQMF